MRIDIFMWDCGDEVCDCTQPRIMVYSEYGFNDPLWAPPHLVADGPLYSMPEAHELEEQNKWLEDAKAWYKLDQPPPK